MTNINCTYAGLAEYSCFLAAVFGLLLMRRHEAATAETTAHKHRTWIGNPLIFTSISTFLVLRAVMTDPLQGLAIVSVLASGIAAFHLRFGAHALYGTPVADA